MNIYLLERPDSDYAGYDEYIGCVVIAESESDARVMHPSGYNREWGAVYGWLKTPEEVVVTLIGKALDSETKSRIVIDSYKAG